MDTLSGFNYISPFTENEKPPDGAKLITDKPLSVFDNDFNYYVGANQYLSGKRVVEGFLKHKPKDNEMIFFCETDSQDTSNLFGTLFLVKIGTNFKSLLLSFNEEIPVKVNSTLNTNSSTTAHQVSTFDSFLNDIYKFLQKEYGGYIEKDFLTFERVKNMIEDELSFTQQARRTLGEVMSWQNDGLDYLMDKSDAFFESIMFKKEDYTPEKEKDFVNDVADFFSDVADYIIPDSVEELLNQMLSKVKKFIEDKLPENWKKLLLKLQVYMEQALEILNIIANDVYKGYYVIKAFFCGLVNGLLSIVQFVIQAFCWLNKNHASAFFTGELYLSIQSSLESIEDFIDVFYETKDDLIAGMKKLIHDFELESLLAIVKALYGNNETNYSVYDYAYLAGRIIFEIVIAVLLTLFTGGGEAIKIASSLSQKAIEIAKLVGREAISVVSGGIVDLVALLKSFLLKFAQAAKKGWKVLKEFFEELLGVGKPKENEIEEVVVVGRKVAEGAGASSYRKLSRIYDYIGKLKNVRKFENEIRSLEYEAAKIFDDKGNELSGIITQKKLDGVEFSFEEIYQAEKLAGKGNLVITHNHPKNSSISYVDIEMFIANNLKELRAITKEQKTFCLQKKGKLPSWEDYEKIIQPVAFERYNQKNAQLINTMRKISNKNSQSFINANNKLKQLYADELLYQLKDVMKYTRYQ